MQLLDLASELMELVRENTELKSELSRVRQEAAELQRLLSVVSQTSEQPWGAPFGVGRDMPESRAGSS